jgi:hypothetical protein
MRTWLILSLLLLLVVGMQIAEATPIAPTDIEVISSSSRQLPAVSNGTVLAQGGNVTQININALSITKTWQGYFGNVTGNIHLDDANNNTFYIWGNGTNLRGQVYASRTDTLDWVSVNCSSPDQRADEDAALGVASTDADSATNTFDELQHPGFNVGLQPIRADSCFSTFGYVNGVAQNATFNQILLSDSGNHTIYSTIIAYHTAGYNGDTVDFQLLVGENEHVGNIGPTPYYFFVELN